MGVTAVRSGSTEMKDSQASNNPATAGAAAASAEVEEKKINSELWHACAGPLVSLPPAGSLVVYFPQGHSEQVAASMQKELDNTPNYPLLPSKLICQLQSLTLHADTETDEVYAQMTLQPVNKYDREAMLASELGLKQNKQPLEFFCKTLTASDTSTHGGFSVPRRAAEKIFPPLDYTMQPPAQELVAKDLHDVSWKFRHIYRGQPKRHLLTTGWSVFVSSKRLLAGDSVLFIRDEKQQLLLGIRRANRPQPMLSSSVLSSDSMHIGVLAAAAHAATNNSQFTIFYNPRASPCEFVIPLAKYNKALYTQISLGMRFRMLFETEDSGVRRYMGTVTGISDLDAVRWKNSHWRNLQVGWDESTATERRTRVSIWEIEPVATPFYICPPPFFRPTFPKQPGQPESEAEVESMYKRAMPWIADDFALKDVQSALFPGLSLVQWMAMQQNQQQQLNVLPQTQQLASGTSATHEVVTNNMDDHTRRLNGQQQILSSTNLQFASKAAYPPGMIFGQQQQTTQQQLSMQQQKQELLQQLPVANQKNQAQMLQQNLAHLQQQQQQQYQEQSQRQLAQLQQLKSSGNVEPANLQKLKEQQQQQPTSGSQLMQQQQAHLLNHHGLLPPPSPQLQPQAVARSLAQFQGAHSLPAAAAAGTMQQPSEFQNAAVMQSPQQQLQHLCQPELQLQLLQQLQQQQLLLSQLGQQHQSQLVQQISQKSPEFLQQQNIHRQLSSPDILQSSHLKQHHAAANHMTDSAKQELGRTRSALNNADGPSCSAAPFSMCNGSPLNSLNKANQWNGNFTDLTAASPMENLLHEIQSKADSQSKNELQGRKELTNLPTRNLTSDQLDASSASSFCLDDSVHEGFSFPPLGLDNNMQADLRDSLLMAETVDGLMPDVLLSRGTMAVKVADNLPSGQRCPRDVETELSSAAFSSQSFGVQDVSFRAGCSSEVAITDSGTANPGLWNSQAQRMRSFTKVQKRGSVGRSIDVTRYKGYDELRHDLACMFGIQGQLEDPIRTDWKLVYVDHENDILLVGDDPWEEFVSCVKSIKILSAAEVQQMSLDGDLPAQAQACSGSGDANVW